MINDAIYIKFGCVSLCFKTPYFHISQTLTIQPPAEPRSRLLRSPEVSPGPPLFTITPKLQERPCKIRPPPAQPLSRDRQMDLSLLDVLAPKVVRPIEAVSEVLTVPEIHHHIPCLEMLFVRRIPHVDPPPPNLATKLRMLKPLTSFSPPRKTVSKLRSSSPPPSRPITPSLKPFPEPLSPLVTKERPKKKKLPTIPLGKPRRAVAVKPRPRTRSQITNDRHFTESRPKKPKTPKSPPVKRRATMVTAPVFFFCLTPPPLPSRSRQCCFRKRLACFFFVFCFLLLFSTLLCFYTKTVDYEEFFYPTFSSLPPSSSPPPYAGVMGCGAAEVTGLGFVCFVVLNPRVLSANRVVLSFFFVS